MYGVIAVVALVVVLIAVIIVIAVTSAQAALLCVCRVSSAGMVVVATGDDGRWAVVVLVLAFAPGALSHV